MTYLPANNDSPYYAGSLGQNQKVLEWLSRLTQAGPSFENLGGPFYPQEKTSVEQPEGTPLFDDWQIIANISGYSFKDFIDAGSSLPLTAAEIDYFRRNHRDTESRISRDFLSARSDLPSPLSELYGLYLYRARVDAEATLFVAQATGSTRVARVMADLLAVGSFANALEYITYLGRTYSVPAAIDTSDVIDRVNHEAARRLSLSALHPSYLLKMTPDEITVLAANIAEKYTIAPADFLEKANLLTEARQDVARLPFNQHFTTAIIERDLPIQQIWVARLCAAYARLMENWVSGLPEIEAVVQ